MTERQTSFIFPKRVNNQIIEFIEQFLFVTCTDLALRGFLRTKRPDSVYFVEKMELHNLICFKL